MNGFIDSSGRALIRIDVCAVDQDQVSPIEVWIDTGFTGDLVLPYSVAESLQLEKSGTVDAVLADGSAIELSTFTCMIEWFGERRRLEVVANEGERPLLGVGLLLGLELRANYRTLELSLNNG